MDQFGNILTETLSDTAVGILIGSGLDWAFPAPVAIDSSNFLKQMLEIGGQIVANGVLSVYYFRFMTSRGSTDITRGLIYTGVSLFVCQPNLQIKMQELGLAMQMFLTKEDGSLWNKYASWENPSSKIGPNPIIGSQDPRSQSALPNFTVQQGSQDDNLNQLMSQNNTLNAPQIPYQN